MFCAHCGISLPEEVKFCHQCGSPQQIDQSGIRICTVQFREIQEKWSLFGKDICRFEAVTEEGALIAASDKITLSGFEISGPNPKNRKHKAAFDGLVANLLATGWQQQDQIGGQWFQLSFRQK